MSPSKHIQPPDLDALRPPFSTQAGRYTGIGLSASQGTLKEFPLKWATALSTVLHIFTPVALVGLVALLLFLLSWLLNINLWDWLKPKAQVKDVEFVLVQDNQAKRPDKATFSGEFNQEAGGKTDPTREVAPIEKPSQASAPQAAAPAQAQQQPSKPQPQAPPPKPQQAQPTPQPQAAQPQQQPPAPPVKKPTTRNAPPPSPATPTIPVPSTANVSGPPSPKIASAQGPITQQSNSSSSSGPVSIPSNGALAQSAAGHPGVASAASRSGGASGNPEEGPGRIPGVSTREADFGPYMAELKRRLTRNWHPPRGERTKRVVLRFEISREGRLLSIDVDKTSGEPLADEAAINAVKLSAPFRQLPPEFQGDSVPVLFTFDYTVYGNSTKFERVAR